MTKHDRAPNDHASQAEMVIVRAILRAARPDQIRRLLDDIRASGSGEEKMTAQ